MEDWFPSGLNTLCSSDWNIFKQAIQGPQQSLTTAKFRHFQVSQTSGHPAFNVVDEWIATWGRPMYRQSSLGCFGQICTAYAHELYFSASGQNSWHRH